MQGACTFRDKGVGRGLLLLQIYNMDAHGAMQMPHGGAERRLIPTSEDVAVVPCNTSSTQLLRALLRPLLRRTCLGRS